MISAHGPFHTEKGTRDENQVSSTSSSRSRKISSGAHLRISRVFLIKVYIAYDDNVVEPMLDDTPKRHYQSWHARRHLSYISTSQVLVERRPTCHFLLPCHSCIFCSRHSLSRTIMQESELNDPSGIHLKFSFVDNFESF